MVRKALRIISEDVCLTEVVRKGISEEVALELRPEQRESGGHLDFWVGALVLVLLEL